MADGVAVAAAGQRARRPHDLAEGPRRRRSHDHPVARRCRGPSTPRPAIVDVVAPLMDGVDAAGGACACSGSSRRSSASRAEQLQLDGLGDEADGAPRSGATASLAIDRVRGRFGTAAIGPASALSADGLRIVRRGRAAMGSERAGRGRTTGNRGLRWRSERGRMREADATLRERTADPPPDRAAARAGPHVLDPRLPHPPAPCGLLWRSRSWPPRAHGAAAVVTVWLSLAAFVGSLALAVVLEREVRLVAREKVGALPHQRLARRPPPRRGRRRRPTRTDDRTGARASRTPPSRGQCQTVK